MAIANIFGRHADPRLIEGITRDDGSQCGAQSITSLRPYNYSGQQAPFWIDYISDTGDGWDATYTVAYHAAQDKLTLSTSEARGDGTNGVQTERGSILIFGGDEVYPAASLEAYETRLILPFEYAFPDHDADGSLRSSPHVFAVPGNHDWYDSLVSFTRLFCSRGSIAGWKAPQQRSYFALKLPKGWWLIGTDLQLGNDIDGPQHAFFERLNEQIGHDESIILCHAEPNWINEEIYPDEYAYRSIRELEALFGERVRLFLAGDYHYYSRHENESGVQKIVAGGGGAFLHLTHGHDDTVLERGGQGRFYCRKKFPPRQYSWWLAWTNLFLFPIHNWSFGFATAPAYAVTASALITPDIQANSAAELLLQVVQRLSWEPFSLFWVVAVATGVVFFTDTSKLWYRWSAGLVHAFSHIAAAVLLGGAIAATLRTWLSTFGPEWLAWQPPLAAVATGAAGYIVGPLVLALYLTLSLNLFRHHRDDASSALRSPHYKNFLRLCITPSGELTVYPVGIRRVANKFGPSADSTPSRLKPLNGTRPILIEDPVVIRPQQGACSPEPFSGPGAVTGRA